VVCETEARMTARCLASASLVRPSPFDPDHEFSGIKVEIEAPEIFRVSLPDGTVAIIAPGETTPKRVSLNGLEVEGTHLRYVQASKDLNEICGLGVTHLAGLATFDEPATFRLKRSSNGTVHARTNTGLSFTDQWLGGPARCIEVKTLDERWQDLTAQCQGSSLPLRLVQEWSERNQRTLVDFRINQ